LSDINKMSPGTGRRLKEDNTTVNIADKIEAIANVLDIDLSTLATEVTLVAILAKIIAAPATEAKQDTLIAKDFATQTTLEAVLAKIIAAPSTEATLEAVRALLAGTINTQLTGSRIEPVAHRTNVTAVDKVPSITITAADQPAIPVSGGTLTAVAHGIGVSPGNSYGSAGVSALVTVTPTVNKSIDVTIPQATGAEYYDIFLSTSTTAPLWVARIAETQRAEGCAITAVGTVGAGGSAGIVNVQVVGTGAASTGTIFAANNAYVFSGIEKIACLGKTKAYIYIKTTVTDLRSAPSVGIVPFFSKNDESNDWYAIDANLLSVLGGISGQPLPQVVVVDVNSVKNLIILVDVIAGQGTAVSIEVELY